MDGDKFISTAKNTNNTSPEDENNFFVQSDLFSSPFHAQEGLRHINDYDSNILKEDAYKDVSDDILKIEYKISKTEKELKELEKQIQTSIEINDFVSTENLNIRKQQIENNLKELTEVYNELSLSAKISGNITSKIKNNFSFAQKAFEGFGSLILSKLPGKISSFIEIRNSLTKLENINKSVDELMTAQYPYGEAEYRYNQLSQYISRANTIQSEISKFIK